MFVGPDVTVCVAVAVGGAGAGVRVEVAGVPAVGLSVMVGDWVGLAVGPATPLSTTRLSKFVSQLSVLTMVTGLQVAAQFVARVTGA